MITDWPVFLDFQSLPSWLKLGSNRHFMTVIAKLSVDKCNEFRRGLESSKRISSAGDKDNRKYLFAVSRPEKHLVLNYSENSLHSCNSLQLVVNASETPFIRCRHCLVDVNTVRRKVGLLTAWKWDESNTGTSLPKPNGFEKFAFRKDKGNFLILFLYSVEASLQYPNQVKSWFNGLFISSTWNVELSVLSIRLLKQSMRTEANYVLRGTFLEPTGMSH